MRWISMLGGGLSCALALAIAGCSAPAGDAVDEGEVAGVELMLTTTPSDAKCYRITLSGASTLTQTFQPTAGSVAPVLIAGLPTGSFSLGLDAFNVACASLVATTPATWVSVPVNVTLTPGSLSPVTIDMKRPAQTGVTVDFDNSLLIAGAVSDPAVVALAVAEPLLYVGRRTSVSSVPTAGGGVSSLGTVTSLTDLQADSNGLYFLDGTDARWAKFGRNAVWFGVPASNLLATPAGLLANYQVGYFGTGVIQRLTGSGVVPVTLTSNLYLAGKMASDNASSVYIMSSSSIYRMPLTGGVPVNVYFASGDTVNDIAADASFVYIARSPFEGSAIVKIAPTGGAVQPIAAVNNGTAIRVQVDGTNLYYLVKQDLLNGGCAGAAIQRVSKTGGTPTTLWAKSGVCPTTFTIGASHVFFDQGGAVRRIDK